MTSRHILIVEDEHALAAALGAMVRRLGFEGVPCYSGQRALELLAENPRAAIIDIGLPDMSGLRLLEHIRGQLPHLPVLVITAHGNLENALAAKKLGSTSYLVKPLDLPQVAESIRQMVAEPPPASDPPPGRSAAPEAMPLIVGAAAAMQRPFVEIAHACASDAPVLISGPTGAGKTLAARVIHGNSARQGGPFVTLHCAALPEPLLESELFGHEKNAFTGALAARTGHIERAVGGTLFLDEIGDIPPGIQAKLLRFVEEKTFTRVGGREDLRADLRLVTATHRHLREEVRAGRFREDLYYRLHVLEVGMPPLTQRREDIPALCAVLLGAMAPGRPLRLAPEVLELLGRHSWPGNVRELRNVLEHAVAVSSGGVILSQHLPRDFRAQAGEAGEAGGGPATDFDAAFEGWIDEALRSGTDYDGIHDRLEAKLLRALLARYDQKPTALARALNINRVTLRRKCREFFGREDEGAGTEER